MFNNESIQIQATLSLAAITMAVGGLLYMTDYSYRAEDTVAVSRPADSAVEFGLPRQNLLLFFYHPKCPCTLAAVEELEKLVATIQDSITIRAFAFCPAGQNRDWIETSATHRLRRIHEAVVVPDYDGEATHRWGITSSGHVLYFNHSETLVFSGGNTRGRGLVGECQPTHELLARIHGLSSELFSWPVYGCPIIAH